MIKKQIKILIGIIVVLLFAVFFYSLIRVSEYASYPHATITDPPGRASADEPLFFEDTIVLDKMISDKYLKFYNAHSETIIDATLSLSGCMD